TQNLTNAIAALRAQVRARHLGDRQALLIATQAVKEQGEYVGQVQMTLKGNTEQMTLSKVTATWVKEKMRQQS
ncbi:hypothetical protein ACPV5G_21940, partial [Photobacterium damselae]|uniref:hypothetical protein n=1 Tax=Photobacterium damselae TaxID=38293 RepID=UPI0040679257